MPVLPQLGELAMTTTRSNAPESEALTLADVEIFENARQAVMTLKKTFDTWVVIGRAVVQARKICDERGQRNTKAFMRLVEQQGLGTLVDKSTATRLEKIIANLPAVTAWRATLSGDKQYKWASPSSVCSRCPALNPARTPEQQEAARASRPERMMVETAQYSALLEEVEQLRNREDGDRWRPTDTASDIARVMVGTFSARKAKAIANEILEQLNQRDRSEAAAQQPARP
jgi:hypothetical protein